MAHITKKLMACIPPKRPGVGSTYYQIGAIMFEEGENGDDPRVFLKIDTLPLPGSGWEGWVNVWESKEAKAKTGNTPDEDPPF